LSGLVKLVAKGTESITKSIARGLRVVEEGVPQLALHNIDRVMGKSIDRMLG
jgi:hypothetical protein